MNIELSYNRKLEGTHGELYKYGEALLGAYVVSTRAANKIGKLEGAIRRQAGDYERTYSVPDKHYAALLKILGITKQAVLKRD